MVQFVKIISDTGTILTTPSQNPDFSKGVNISIGPTSSYSSISWGADNTDIHAKSMRLALLRKCQKFVQSKVHNKIHTISYRFFNIGRTSSFRNSFMFRLPILLRFEKIMKSLKYDKSDLNIVIWTINL